MARYIFVTGGVVSSLGKGLTSASLAYLLQSRGYKVRIRKLDPYLNVDPGTMSPFQHGEVFVTDDGAETDLDLARLVDSISNATRRIYQLPELHIELNVPAKITWFTPKQKFLSPKISGGVNNPWENQELSGVVYGTINGERIHLND